ncbi:MAG: AAA family ATPase [Pseudanabaena sp. ELA645]|jgi:AAA15 family ATPase/GTPase
MLKSLKIENFRCFPSFEMQQLGRLNLLVGTNNSGKTSILEALQLLFELPINPALFGEIVMGRSEYTNEDGVIRLAVRHLFCNHRINEKAQISILGKNQIDESRSISILKLSKMLSVSQLDGLKNTIIELLSLPISPDDIVIIDAKTITEWEQGYDNTLSKTQFIDSSSLSSKKMIELFERIVITPEEDIVIESLQVIEPRFKRIASFSSGKYRYEGLHSGFIVQLSDEPQRIPIGSMGDGMWRMLGLALAIVNAKDGVLLVDEIDTGLHFTVMSDMWKMIWETAKRLNVQVFATTHSNDCWQSLADIANAENPSEDGITIHRIEKGKQNSIVFTERQIAIAAERNIEVR